MAMIATATETAMTEPTMEEAMIADTMIERSGTEHDGGRNWFDNNSCVLFLLTSFSVSYSDIY
jgi:hypothetical protein